MNKPEVKPATTAQYQAANGPKKKVTKEEFAKQMKRMRDRDAEMVTGVFKNLEHQGVGGGRGALVFSYKFYHGDENVIYELLDGERYTIPRGVARHLNNNCYYKEYQRLQGEFGATGMREAVNPDGRLQTSQFQAAKKIHRFAFHSLEYMDDDSDMYPADLIEVNKVL